MGAETEATGFDPLDPRINKDPYPLYREARESEPVQYIEQLGLWAVLSYDGTRSIMRNPDAEMPFEEFQRLRQGEDVVHEPYFKALRHAVLFQRGEDHRRVRLAFSRRLNPPRVEKLRPQIQERARELVDGFVDDGEADLVKQFNRPLPLGTISALLGVPREAHDRLAKWIEAFQHVITFVPMDDEQLAEGNAAVEGLNEYFSDLVARRREGPAEDLLSALISEADEGNLGDEELLVNAWFLYFAGHDTSTNALGNALVTLFDSPDQMDALRSDLDQLPAAVEELIRVGHPATANFRVMPEDVEIDGKVIPANSPVVFYIPSANRDAKQFEDPERFDVYREPEETLNFGNGTHKCPGQHLAKATLNAGLAELLTRLPGLRLEVAKQDIEWTSSPVLHGPISLPVKWDPPD